MPSFRLKLLLFSIYFLVTTILPILLLAVLFVNPVITNFGNQRAVHILFWASVMMIVLIVGNFEWRYIPTEPAKIAVWMLFPVITLLVSFIISGSQTVVSTLRNEGGAILIGTILALFIEEIKTGWRQRRIALANMETYKNSKTPFLQSYWKNKTKHAFLHTIGEAMVFLVMAALLCLALSVVLFQHSSPQQLLYKIMIFLILAISNAFVFSKTKSKSYAA